ncbi:hypothetical protein [Encephalitozoon cuniculi GB-M1]|uniref:Ricin B lectin domain-containing protein n=2 Tax=Encephalitozoon cuniculi TaxID=6035 RepID=Q8SUY8_ENCCU|nr:uncharacterized protein ECU07_1080 [Encephalitozoon cuniculi GB-M1]AGE95844.1 hypothetical protein ECU07_1080 [Encephalitozoon cuniculi]KMV65833.1 hypothetical protein M970_071050 [Encephalitozoon cuniculi EcunIII-L]UYI27271.1 hypothetical protein J0A71_05g11300 [Encephalitozoon cuniculi]CAD25641.1 hypothetical protein [Encephalitozoon cuniculi GB-M1]
MSLALFVGTVLSYPLYLDSLTNKPIRITPVGNKYLSLSEFVRDFGPNPFRTVSALEPGNGYNTRSQINRNGGVFKVRIGGSWLCRRKKDLTKCTEKADFWSISRGGDGFIISQEGYCLSTGDGDKLGLERCDGKSRSHVFFFKDMGVEECLDSVDLDARPRTEAEMVKQLKLKKKLRDLGKKDKDAAQKIREKLEEKNNFEKYAEKNLPDLNGKDDSKEVLKKLWNFGWRRPRFGTFKFPWFSFPFCKKLW